MFSTFIAAIVDEPPNIVSLLYQYFIDAPWAHYLHDWENIIFSVLIAMIITLVFRLGIKKKALIPTGLQNFLELVVDFFSKVLFDVLGPDGRKYTPFLGTLFIYILTMNLFGLVPLMKAPSSSLNITIALAICVFAYVQYLNIKNMGFFGFIHHLMGSPKDFIGWLLVPLMLPLEILTQIARPATLALRLFGNILGEEALVGYFTLAGVLAFAALNLPVNAGIPLQIPFMFLGILTSLMQALVFTLLSAVYILLSNPHAENHSIKE